MAEQQEYLVAVIGADVTAFRRGMREVRREIGVLDAETTQAVSRLGRTLTYTLTTPLLIAGGAMTKAASDFEAEMRNINSIAFMGETAFAGLSDEVLEFGKNTRAGATEAAKALYTIYSAGMAGESAFDLMKVATITAEAGLADITTTSEGMVAAMLSFGFTTEEEAWRVSNAMTRMVQVGVGSMQQFVGSIATFLPAASALGVEIEEAFAINARLTQMGYSASEAAVRVNAAMRSMIKPTEAMQAAFKKLGVKGTADLIEQSGGLAEALFALKGTTNGTEEELAKLFSDTRALQGVLLLTENIDETRKVLEEFKAALPGATMKAWEQQTKSFAYQWDLLKAAIGAAAITIGSKLLPVLAPIVTVVKDFFIGITELEDSTIRWGIAISGAVAALGPLLWIIGSLASPFGIIVGAVAAVHHAFETNFNGIRTIVEDARFWMEQALKPVTDVIDTFLKSLQPPEAPKVDWTPEVTVGTPTFTSYTVQPGDGFWNVWQGMFPNGEMTWAEFQKQAGIDFSVTLQPGQLIKLGDGGTTGTNPFLIVAEELVNRGLAELHAPPTAVDNFFAAFGDEKARTALTTSLTEAFNKAIPAVAVVVDEHGGQLFRALAAGFKPTGTTGTGESPFFTAIRDAINGAGDLLGGGLAETFPNMSAALNTLLTNMGDWIKKEGVPTISRAFGYIIGRVGVLAGQAIQGILGGLGGASGGVAQTINDSLAQPFSQGFQDAMSDAGQTGDDWTTNVLTGLAGGLAVAAVAKWGLFSGAALAIRTAIGLALGAMTWPFAFAASIFGGIASAVQTGGATAVASSGLGAKLGTALANFFVLNPITAGIAIGAATYFIMPEETKTAIRNGFYDLIGGIIGMPGDETASMVDDALTRIITDVLLDVGGYDYETEVAVKLNMNMKPGMMPGTIEGAGTEIVRWTEENQSWLQGEFRKIAGTLGYDPETLRSLIFDQDEMQNIEIPVGFIPMQMTPEDRTKFLSMMEQMLIATAPDQLDNFMDFLVEVPINLKPVMNIDDNPWANAEKYNPTDGEMPFDPGSMQAPTSAPTAVGTWFEQMMNGPAMQAIQASAAADAAKNLGSNFSSSIQSLDTTDIRAAAKAHFVNPVGETLTAGFGLGSTTLDPLNIIPERMDEVISQTDTAVSTWSTTFPVLLTTLKDNMVNPINELIDLWTRYWAAVTNNGMGGGTSYATPGGPPSDPNGPTYSTATPPPPTEDPAYPVGTYVPPEGETVQSVPPTQVNVYGVQNTDRLLADLKRRGIKVSQ